MRAPALTAARVLGSAAATQRPSPKHQRVLPFLWVPFSYSRAPMLPVMAQAGNYCTHCMPRAHEVSPGPRVGMQEYIKGYNAVTSCWWTRQESPTCAFQCRQCKHTTISFPCTLMIALLSRCKSLYGSVGHDKRCRAPVCAFKMSFVRNHLGRHYRHLTCTCSDRCSPTMHATRCGAGRSCSCMCCAGGDMTSTTHHVAKRHRVQAPDSLCSSSPDSSPVSPVGQGSRGLQRQPMSAATSQVPNRSLGHGSLARTVRAMHLLAGKYMCHEKSMCAAVGPRGAWAAPAAVITLKPT